VAERNTPTHPTHRTERRRYFNDPDGVHWEVHEIKSPDYDRRGGYCLIFESANVVRRVRAYPADWFEWAAQDLYELSLRP
jgi:hypothetical protein